MPAGMPSIEATNYTVAARSYYTTRLVVRSSTWDGLPTMLHTDSANQEVRRIVVRVRVYAIVLACCV